MPRDYEEFVVFFMVISLAAWGGLANYIYRIKTGVVRAFSFLELIGEFVISGFAGVLIYLVGTNYGVSPPLVAAMAGIAGHAGSRCVFALERVYERRLGSWANRLAGEGRDKKSVD